MYSLHEKRGARTSPHRSGRGATVMAAHGKAGKRSHAGTAKSNARIIAGRPKQSGAQQS